MTLLIISHMRDVMVHLLKDNPHIKHVYLANISLADRLYYGALFKKHHIPFTHISYQAYSKEECFRVHDRVKALFEQSIEALRLSQDKVNNQLIDHYANLYLNAQYWFQHYRIDATCTWNGQRIFDLIINHHAKASHIKTFFYEMGLFRPNTLTIDTHGVNIHNSLPRNADFYSKYTPQKKLTHPQRTSLQPSSKLVYNLYKSFDHFLAKLQVKTYKRFDKLYTLPKLQKKTMLTSVPIEHFNAEYLNIFCPLQTANDTQILLNSPHVKSMSHFMELIENSAAEFEKQTIKVRFYIKVHPLEKHVKLHFHSKNIFVLHHNISSTQTIQHADAVLTINSTVGLEAIEQLKPCITLAPSFYSIAPIAFYSEPHQLVETLQLAIARSDQKLQQQFISYLKERYQLHYNPFNILSYETKEHHMKFMELYNEK